MPKRPSKKRAAAKPGTVKSPFSQGQVDAFVNARDRVAGGNPAVVRKAFLGGGSVPVDGVAVGAVSLGIFWLLEEIGSPFAVASGAGDAPANISFQDLSRAAFILSGPLAARNALDKGRPAFERAAFEFACQRSMATLNELTAALTGQMANAQESMPPPAASDSKNPSEPPAQAQDSVGG